MTRAVQRAVFVEREREVNLRHSAASPSPHHLRLTESSHHHTATFNKHHTAVSEKQQTRNY